MRSPDFIIAGTQKAATTWLRDTLFKHPSISGVDRQIHFFDRHYHKGIKWYEKQFTNNPDAMFVGEKTTEYFDTVTAAKVAKRIGNDFPMAKVIIILRNPVARAISALKHTVVSGLEPLPKNFDEALFADRLRSEEESHRFIDRGFYAQQIKEFQKYIPPSQLLILIFEEDILTNPIQGLHRTLNFLGVNSDIPFTQLAPTNSRHLSPIGIKLMYLLRKVPYARSLIWRLDIRLPFQRWNPTISKATLKRLQEIYRPENEALYSILGRRIPAWETN